MAGGALPLRALPGARRAAKDSRAIRGGLSEARLRPQGRRGKRLAVFGAAAVAAASVALFVVSKGKWTDAIVDIGNEWIWPDALARGHLLYRDVVYWFGPFTPYFHAAFFAICGSSFRTLALAGVVGSALTLLALLACLVRVTARAEALLWTALAIPLLVFMRFSGGGILGMGYRMWHAAGFALAACAVVFAPRRRESRGRRQGASSARSSTAWIGGGLVGLAGLCRADWGLLSLAAVLAGVGLRGPDADTASRRAAVIAAAAIGTFAMGMLPFVAAAGWSVFLTESHVFLIGLPVETRRSALAWMGVDRWPWGMWSWVYSTAFWFSAFWVAEAAVLRRADPAGLRRRLPALLGGGAVLGCGAIIGLPVGSLELSWVPLVCALAIFRAVRSGRRGALLLAVGLIGLLGSLRRIFDLRDFGYVAPPVLFAVVCAAALVHGSLRLRERNSRRRVERAVRVALSLALAAFFLLRGSQYTEDARVPIPGTDGFLTASPARAAELAAMARRIREQTPDGSGLAVFPDGAVLNFLSGRENPLRHKLYVAGYLGSTDEGRIIEELRRDAPAAVAIVDRPDGQLPNRVFGVDYGVSVRAWLEERYTLAPVANRPADPAGYPALLGLPRAEAFTAEPRGPL